MRCVSKAEQARTAEESIKRGNTSKAFLPFSLISNKEGPTGKGAQTGGNPCLPVHLGWGGRRILVLTQPLSLTNCPASCNLCNDSDISSKMMPKPTPCHALDRRGCMCCHDKAHCIYFKLLIKSVCLKHFFHCAPKKIDARGMMQKHASCVRDSVNYRIRRDS